MGIEMKITFVSYNFFFFNKLYIVYLHSAYLFIFYSKNCVSGTAFFLFYFPSFF